MFVPKVLSERCKGTRPVPSVGTPVKSLLLSPRHRSEKRRSEKDRSNKVDREAELRQVESQDDQTDVSPTKIFWSALLHPYSLLDSACPSRLPDRERS